MSSNRLGFSTCNFLLSAKHTRNVQSAVGDNRDSGNKSNLPHLAFSSRSTMVSH